MGIGRKFEDATVQSDMKHWPFKVTAFGDKPKLEVEYKNETKTFTPEEISAMVLTKMKDKISDDDRKAINDKCDEAIKWLDANQLAEVEEFNEKQKEVEAVCNPIITKLYG